MKCHHKIILIGDSGAGKTSLLQHLKKEEFSFEVPQTFGTQIYLINQVYQNIKHHFKIYDTSGCETFQLIVERLIGQMDAAIICFDASKKCYTKQIREWIGLVEMQRDSLPIYLIGNKSDLIDQVQMDDFSIKYPLFFTSCKTGENVDEAFKQVFHSISNNQIRSVVQKIEIKPKSSWKFCLCCFSQ